MKKDLEGFTTYEVSVKIANTNEVEEFELTCKSEKEVERFINKKYKGCNIWDIDFWEYDGVIEVCTKVEYK